MGDDLAGIALTRLVDDVRSDVELLQNAQTEARKHGTPSIEAIEAWNDVAIFDRFLARLVGAGSADKMPEPPLDDSIWQAVAADDEFADHLKQARATVIDLLAHTGNARFTDPDANERFSGLATRLRADVTKAREVLIRHIDEETANDFSEEPRGRSMNIASEGRQAYAERGSERVLDTQKASAGEQSAFDFGRHFAAVARSERRWSDALRLITVGALAAISYVGWSTVDQLGPELRFDSWLIHLTIVLPLAAAAGFLGRESMRHRVASRAAAHLAAQLRTLPIFAVDQEKEIAEDAWKSVAKVVFSTYAPIDDRKSIGVYGDFKDVIAELGKTTRALADRLPDPNKR